MSEPERLTPNDMFTLTASALRKVRDRGARGVEQVTHDEIVALVGMLSVFARDALSQLIAEGETPDA